MRQMLQPVLFLAATRFFFNLRECFMPTDASFLYLSVFLSLSSIHILWIESFFESLFLALRSFGSSPFRDKRPPARLCGRSRACVSCVVSNSFDILLRVGAEIRSCALPKERKQTSKLYVLPQDHGALSYATKLKSNCTCRRSELD